MPPVRVMSICRWLELPAASVALKLRWLTPTSSARPTKEKLPSAATLTTVSGPSSLALTAPGARPVRMTLALLVLWSPATPVSEPASRSSAVMAGASVS